MVIAEASKIRKPDDTEELAQCVFWEFYQSKI